MNLSRSLVVLFMTLTGCGSAVVETKGAGGGGGATSTSTTTSTPCGSSMCGADEFCKDTSGLCGKGAASEKACVKVGTACSDGEQVCGCDGTIYMSEGCSNLASVSVDVANACAAPAGFFPCGAKYCSSAGQYCRETAQPTMTGEATTYSCEALPDACAGTASCACLPGCEGAPNPADCKLDAAGNATLHCTIG